MGTSDLGTSDMGTSDIGTAVSSESEQESVQESEVRQGSKTCSHLEEEREHGSPMAQGCLAL